MSSQSIVNNLQHMGESGRIPGSPSADQGTPTRVRGSSGIGISAFLDFSNATVLGGADVEWSSDIGVGADGSFAICGYSRSGDFPVTVGAFQASHRGTGYNDVVVAKFDSSGSRIWSTYVGSEFHDYGWGVAVDSAGRVWVCGHTENASHPDNNLPTTTGAMNETHNGNWDAFLIILSSNGSVMEYGTFFGGFENDYAYKLEIDSTETLAWLVGSTESDVTFPTTLGAFNDTMGGSRSAYIAALGVNSSFLNYSSYIGGNDWDEARSLSIAEENGTHTTVALAGLTDDTTTFPVSPGAYDTLGGPGRSAFLFELQVTHWGSSSRTYATYLGHSQQGQEYDFPAIDCSESGIYAFGISTPSSGFPITAGAYQKTPRGAYAGYLAHIRPVSGGAALRHGTYLTGSSADYILGVRYDHRPRQHTLVCGSTQSGDFPIVGERSQGISVGRRDAFLAVFAPVESFGSVLNLSSCYGIDQEDELVAVDALANNDAITVGHTSPSSLGATDQDLMVIDWIIPDNPKISLASWRNVTEVGETLRVNVVTEPANALSGSEIERVQLFVYPEDQPEDSITSYVEDPIDSSHPDTFSVAIEISDDFAGLNLTWKVSSIARDYGLGTVWGSVSIGGEPVEDGDDALWQPPLFTIYLAYLIVAIWVILIVVATMAAGSAWVRPLIGLVYGYYVVALGSGAGFMIFGGITELFPLWQILATGGYAILWALGATFRFLRRRGTPLQYQGFFLGLAGGLAILAILTASQVVEPWLNIWFWTFTVGAVASGLASLGREQLSRIKYRGFSAQHVMWIASAVASVVTILSVLGVI